jgi:TonB family protein
LAASLHSIRIVNACRHARFSDSVIDELRSFAMAGLGGLTGDGMETGGILIGEAAGDELRLIACEEAPCEQRKGPEYAPNASDRIRMEEVMAARTRVEGCFRSFVAHDPVPEDADEQFVRRYFPQGDCIYLMMRASSADQCMATVRWFRDGQPLELLNQGPFSLMPGRMPVLRTRPVLPPAVRRVHVEPAPRRRMWVPILGCVLLGMVGGVGFELWSLGRGHEPEAPPAVAAASTQPAEWTDLQLDAHPSGRQIDITWNSAAVREVHATGGSLAITDGDSRQGFALSAGQVNAGKYRYNAKHPDLAVRLIVTAGGQGVASDSVRLTMAVATPPPTESMPDAGGSAIVPPSTLHEVQPAIPDGIRSRLSGEVVIPVQVQVSNRGRVLSAQASDQGSDGVHRYLAEQAEKAARTWQFSPARNRAGVAVAGSKTIQFVFAP